MAGREIVELLNKPPFEKGFTLIRHAPAPPSRRRRRSPRVSERVRLRSFDGLPPIQLLQTLNDVFAELDEVHRVVVKHESPEDTVARLLAALRVQRFKPEQDKTAFRNGLIAGEKEVPPTTPTPPSHGTDGS